MGDWGNKVTVGLRVQVRRGLAQGASCVTSPVDRFQSSPLKQDTMLETLSWSRRGIAARSHVYAWDCVKIYKVQFGWDRPTLGIMNHTWCASDLQPESSPHVSTGLLPVLGLSFFFFFYKRKLNNSSRLKKSTKVFAALMSHKQKFLKVLRRNARVESSVFMNVLECRC